jgi:hypothetical protein
MQTQAMHIIQTLIATLLVYISWGHDEPIYNFALVFGGLLFGHILTETLNYVEGEGE